MVCGYTTYMDLAREFLEGKELVTTLMTRELERCRIALERAEAGETTAMICSGDAGVYGMGRTHPPDGGGVPGGGDRGGPGDHGGLSGAAVLGAPLMHDFAVISLSDLLTPWEVIEKRLDCAGAGDFVVCLYNPMSRRRRDHLARACAILRRHRPGTTVCGWVKNIGRAGEERRLLTLEELEGEQVDMFTTVFIGSSSTQQLSGRMVTPRGYEAKA